MNSCHFKCLWVKTAVLSNKFFSLISFVSSYVKFLCGATFLLTLESHINWIRSISMHVKHLTHWNVRRKWFAQSMNSRICCYCSIVFFFGKFSIYSVVTSIICQSFCAIFVHININMNAIILHTLSVHFPPSSPTDGFFFSILWFLKANFGHFQVRTFPMCRIFQRSTEKWQFYVLYCDLFILANAKHYIEWTMECVYCQFVCWCECVHRAHA